MPPRSKNFDEKERQVGVELEFSGCEPQQILDCIIDCFGGDVTKNSIFNYQIENTDVGDFTVELDAQILQKMVEPSSKEAPEDSGKNYTETLLKSAAESLVPWEVVTPPIIISRLSELNSMVACLRKKGALGTHHAARFAFGLHLNPDLPDLSADTIVRYMQAYLCLYDWIYANEKIDVARKITPYINHFDKDYILKVVDTQYQPDLNTFIKDYLEHNPSRNRSLDLLPLIAHIDEKWVAQHKEKALIKARPTFHYRLPNCDIDNPDWSLAHPWSLWLKVEQLANNKEALENFMEEFREDYQRFTRAIDNKWVDKCDQLLQRLDSESAS
jgi:hypothetical protein